MQMDPKNPDRGEERQEDQEERNDRSLNQNNHHTYEQKENVDDPEVFTGTNKNQEDPGTDLPVKEAKPSTNEHAKTSSGLEENIAALISYVGGFVTGLIFFFLEKDNKYVRFHALQSIFLTVTWIVIKFVLGFVPFIGWLLVFLLNGLVLAVWIVCMVKAYQKQPIKIPVIGDFADQYK